MIQKDIHPQRTGPGSQNLRVLGVEESPLAYAELKVESVRDDGDLAQIRRKFEDICKEACSHYNCGAIVFLGKVGILNEYSVDSGTLNCQQVDCPLGPPTDGDREPLGPQPSPPSLSAERDAYSHLTVVRSEG